MSNPRLNRPDMRNLQRGTWHCLGAIGKGPCIWLYRAHSGPVYLGRDAHGVETWFGKDRFVDAVALWSRLDGFDYWLSVSDTLPMTPANIPPSRPIPGQRSDLSVSEPVAQAITDSNPAKRDTDLARAMSPTESSVRTAVTVGHTVGGILLSAFGGGALVAPIGGLHDQWLKAAFPS